MGRIGKEMSYLMEVQLAWTDALPDAPTYASLGWPNQPFDALPSHDFQCDVIPPLRVTSDQNNFLSGGHTKFRL